MSGWFAVKRGITSHPIFKKRPDRAFVWLWMLETAAYKDTRQDAGGKPVSVKRGQVLTSFRQIEAATGVGIQVIRTLFKLLEDERAINTDTSNGRLLVTVCNYEKYQSPKDDSNTPANTAPTQRQHTKEQENKITTEEEAKASLSDLAHVDEISQAVSAYNEAAQTAGWAKVQKLSRERRSKLAARLREAGGIEGWRVAMSKARASPLCTGDNERGWVASFDFLISKEKFTRLMEGQYDDRRSSRPDHRAAANSHATDRAIAFAAKAIRTPSRDCF